MRELGIDVTIIQRPKQLMNPFDPDMASMIHNEMRKHGIKLALGYTVEGFKEKNNGVEVLLKDNPSLQADMGVLAIGVTPDTAPVSYTHLLLDTRKTTPNMRIFEKYAVRVGGGYNHRYNLSDGVLLKDNHINAAGGVAEAVKAAQEYAPFVRKIEVETETLEMVREAVEAGADIIMLDNMTPEDMKKAVEITAGKAKTECSGTVSYTHLDVYKRQCQNTLFSLFLP